MGTIRGKCQSYILRAEELKKLAKETAPTKAVESQLPLFFLLLFCLLCLLACGKSDSSLFFDVTDYQSS